MAKAKLEIMGRILVASEENYREEHLYPMALLISFDNPEDIRQAIKDGKVEFEFVEG